MSRENRDDVDERVERDADASEQHQLWKQRFARRDELRQERQKEKCGLDVQHLNHDSLEKSTAQTLRSTRLDHEHLVLAHEQANTQVNQIGSTEILDQVEGH